jgi:hypothetical protein
MSSFLSGVISFSYFLVTLITSFIISLSIGLSEYSAFFLIKPLALDNNIASSFDPVMYELKSNFSTFWR